MGDRNPKRVWLKGVLRATVERKRKEAAWKEVLGAREEVAKERCMEAYKEERQMLKDVFIRDKASEKTI